MKIKKMTRRITSLRAVTDLPEGKDASAFEQKQPLADTSDGIGSYDYYWYGYVAPKYMDTLYEEGEKVIYTIYYADQNSEGEAKTGKLACRLYGSIGNEEAHWYECNEVGQITGEIVEVPVTWEDEDYDKDTEGESIDADNFPWAHQEGCRYYSPISVRSFPWNIS